MKSQILGYRTGAGLGATLLLMVSAPAFLVSFLGGAPQLPFLMPVSFIALVWSAMRLKESFEIRLDTAARRFATRQRTNWITVSKCEGSFDEIDAVRIVAEPRKRVYERSRRDRGLLESGIFEDNESRRVVKHWVVWVIRLVFKNRTQTEPLLERPIRAEFATYLDAERLAKALRVDLIDVTGPGPQVTAWNRLDVRLVEKLRQGPPTAHVDLLTPPPGGRIAVSGPRGSMEIRMPSPGLGKMIPALFFYAAMTGVVAFIVKTQEVEVGEGFLTGMIWLGILLFVPMLVFFTSREIIREERTDFVFESRAFGIPISRQRIRKHEIEDIELRASRHGYGCEVVVRSDRQLIRTGRSEVEGEVLWLSETLRGLLA